MNSHSTCSSLKGGVPCSGLSGGEIQRNSGFVAQDRAHINIFEGNISWDGVIELLYKICTVLLSDDYFGYYIFSLVALSLYVVIRSRRR